MTDKKVETLPAKQEERTVIDAVLDRIRSFAETGALNLPKDYSFENAIRAGFLLLQDTVDSQKRPVLQVCTKDSIANAFLKMVVMGLNPIKKQCDFIAYGDKLTCSPEYTGNILLAKRYGGLKWITGTAVYEGDTFSYEILPDGRKRVLEHKQTLESMGLEIKGAYAVYELNDGTQNTEVMNILQIRNAWNQGYAKGMSPAHKSFPDQMAIKTVINRACKLIIRSSDDAVLMDVDDEPKDVVKENVKHQIASGANKETIGFNKVKKETAKSTIQQNNEDLLESEIILEGENNISQPNDDGPGY